MIIVTLSLGYKTPELAILAVALIGGLFATVTRLRVLRDIVNYFAILPSLLLFFVILLIVPVTSALFILFLSL